ncbi:MAG: hypothetical protein JST84_12305 [Acidobacteria bacterium]|nr:hypothetical protein [Acidobacteriota bacterium]
MSCVVVYPLDFTFVCPTELTAFSDQYDDITWDFNKFLLNRNGKIIARFETKEKPESNKVTQAIEQALK